MGFGMEMEMNIARLSERLFFVLFFGMHVCMHASIHSSIFSFFFPTTGGSKIVNLKDLGD